MGYEPLWYEGRIEKPRSKKTLRACDTLPSLRGMVFYKGRPRKVGYRISSKHELSLQHVEGVRVYDGFGLGFETLGECMSHFFAEVRSRVNEGDKKAARVHELCFE